MSNKPSERTEAQREASRLNGAKSKGPVTAEGKAISSRNSFKHGLDSKYFLLSHESPEVFEAMRATYYEQYQPDNLVEADLLDRYICAMWKAIRFEHIESGVCQIALLRTDEDAAKLEGLNQPQRMAVAMLHMMNDKTADKLSTYAQRNERTAARWLKTLETMQKERRAAAQAEVDRQTRAEKQQSAEQLARAAVEHIARETPERIARQVFKNGPERIHSSYSSQDMKLFAQDIYYPGSPYNTKPETAPQADKQ